MRDAHRCALSDHTLAARFDGDVDGLLHDLRHVADEDGVGVGPDLDPPPVERLADEHELGGDRRR